jgi:hypothetical protein
MDGWLEWVGRVDGCAGHTRCSVHTIISEHRIHPYTILVPVVHLPGATRKKRCRIAVARYLPLAKLPPPALRMSGRSASQLTPRYGLHCRRRPRALELQTRLEPHAWVLGAAGPAAQAEAGAFASASRWALSGTAAPLE